MDWMTLAGTLRDLPLEDFTAALRKFTPKWVAPRRGQLISFPYLVPCVQPRLKVKVRFQSARPFTYRSWLGLIHKPVTVPWWVVSLLV